jgi:hypothetical protein
MADDKIIMAGASWCGFTKKAEKEIQDKGLGDKFTILDCDGPDKTNKYCQGVQGFPMFKRPDNTLCNEGYSPIESVIGKCSVATPAAPPAAAPAAAAPDPMQAIQARVQAIENRLDAHLAPL